MIHNSSASPVWRRGLLFCLLIALIAVAPAMGAGKGEPGPFFWVRVELDGGKIDLERLQLLGIDVDGVFDGWARAHVNREEYDKLTLLGFQLTRLPNEGKIGLARMALEGVAEGEDLLVPAEYHTYETLMADMAAVVIDHPDITRLYTIGQSVQGRNLRMMKITKNPQISEDEPEFAYISSMHGDEVAGKELCFNLINYLTDNYGTDPRVTNLVDNTEIWIMPSMNPDGTKLGQRYNANGFDLNRNFPDYFVDPDNTTLGRQPETGAVMDWTLERNINLSGNYHGGALLINYPLDGNPAGTNTFSPTPEPDHTAIYSISRTYADNNLPMYNNDGAAYLTNGVTNGADWYMIRGGMQDWRYFWHGGFDLTIEVSAAHWPPASELPQFWDDNLESMLSHMEPVHEGLRGIVTAADTGQPLPRAEIRLDSNPHPVYTDVEIGDYHRIVLPGTYTVHVSAPGYLDRTFEDVVVTAGDAVRLDAALEPVPGELQPVGNRVDDAGGNGILDPGEITDLAVTLANSGREATAVQASLKPISWLVDVTRPVATYPDIPIAEQAESNPPHHEVSVSSSAPAGHKAGFYLEWEAAEGRGVTEAFYLEVGEPTCESVSAGDVPQMISALISPHSELTTTSSEIQSLRVHMEILHGYIGDLQVVLTAPSGTTILLHNRAGGSADDIVGIYPDTLTPTEPLSKVSGESANGTWKLDIDDFELPSNGSLESWSIDICGYPAEPTPELRFRDLAVKESDVELRWWEYPGLWSYRVYRSTDPSSAAAFTDVTSEDAVDTDTRFLDGSTDELVFYLVTGVGPQGEGPKGHFGE